MELPSADYDGGGTNAKGGIIWGKPAATPASARYQTLKLMGLVP